MYLGTVAPRREDLEDLIERAQRRVLQITNGIPNGERLAAEHAALSYSDYLRALARFDRLEADIHRWRIADMDQRERMLPPSPALVGFVLRGRSRARTPDEAGWKAYLHEVAPGFGDKVASMYRPSAFPAVHRNRHTFIVAPTGHGKSELLKALVWHDVQHPGASVVVLDPGGDMSRQIARWPELLRSDRLVYVEPELRPGYTVGINPFAGGHLLDEVERGAVAGIIANVLGDITADLSPNMQTLCRYCALVLLGLPDATLRDLQLLIQKPEPEKKIRRSFEFVDDEGDPYEARRQAVLEAAFYHPDVDVKRFFRMDFDTPEYLGTRGWLGTRIKGIAAKIDLRRALFGPDTLKLQQAMDGGKIVVVNLKGYGNEDERADVGRLLVGLVAAFGDLRGRREGSSRRPVHLIVDEATEVASPRMISVLEQLRKFGIHLTLAQQVGGRNFSTEQKAVLFENTRTKIIAHRSKREGAALLGYQGDPEHLPDLTEFQFWVQWHTDPEVRHLAVRSDLTDRSHSVTEEEWQRFADRAVGAYYRRGEAIPAAPVSAPARTPPAPEPTPAAAPTSARPASENQRDGGNLQPPPVKLNLKKPVASPMPPRPTGPGVGSAKPGRRLPKL